MINSDNWSELLLPTLRDIFEKQIKKGKDFIPVLFNVENSTKAQEFNLGIGSLGLMQEWESSGKSVSYEDFAKGHKSTYTHQKFSKGMSVEKEWLDDGLYSQVKKQTKMLGLSGFNSTQSQAVSVFNNAFNGIYLGPDAKPLCSTTHPLSPGNSTTWSNAGTLALSSANVEATRTLMKAWTDDKGNLLDAEPDTLLVPTGLRKTAMVIAETSEEPDTSDHGVNVWKGQLNVIEWSRLTSATTWFLCDSTRMKLFLNWYWRRNLDFKEEVVFNTEVANYAILGRWSKGWDEASFIYGQVG